MASRPSTAVALLADEAAGAREPADPDETLWSYRCLLRLWSPCCSTRAWMPPVEAFDRLLDRRVEVWTTAARILGESLGRVFAYADVAAEVSPISSWRYQIRPSKILRNLGCSPTTTDRIWLTAWR